MVRCVGDSATTRWVLRMCISMPVRLTKNLAVNSLSRDVRRDALLLSCAHGSANDPRGDTTPDMGTLTWQRMPTTSAITTTPQATVRPWAGIGGRRGMCGCV